MAESCANLALLELAQSPNMVSTIKENAAAGCRYQIINPSFYDAENKKIVNIIAIGHYPPQNGAFSRMEIDSTVYDPQYSPPASAGVRQNIEINSWVEK